MITLISCGKVCSRTQHSTKHSGSLGIHESHKRIIYDTLGQLAKNLPGDYVDHLLKKMIETPPSNYDQLLLDLILTFTNIALKAEVCWEIVSELKDCSHRETAIPDWRYSGSSFLRMMEFLWNRPSVMQPRCISQN